MQDMSEIGWMRARLALGIPCGSRPHFRLPGSPRRDIPVPTDEAAPRAERSEAGGGRLRFDPPHPFSRQEVASPDGVPRERPGRAEAADAALGAAPAELLAAVVAELVRNGSAGIVHEAGSEPAGPGAPATEPLDPSAAPAAEKPSFTVAFGLGATYDLLSPTVPSEGPAPDGLVAASHPPTPVGLFADARTAMQYQNGNAQFEVWLDLALRMNAALGADALMLLADDVLKPGARVVVLYSGYEADKVDSLSVINLGEHLERLSASDLQKLEMRVPLDTLKKVVDLALEIGREGREGKPVGTIFVVGDHRKVLENSRSAGFDPVRGYSRRERNLHDRRVREGIKEVAQLDGAFVITADGHVAAACRILDGSSTGLTLPKGLGARHWAAAAITKVCRGVAVAVSESSGTVRLFQNGELMLRIEPFRRPMKWKDFHYEPPTPEPEKVKRERPAVD